MKHTNFSRTLSLSLFAVGLLLFFLIDTVVRFVRGGESSSNLLYTVLSVILLFGGVIVAAIVAWRQWQKLKREREYFEDE